MPPYDGHDGDQYLDRRTASSVLLEVPGQMLKAETQPHQAQAVPWMCKMQGPPTETDVREP